jgi:hypothetical protein
LRIPDRVFSQGGKEWFAQLTAGDQQQEERGQGDAKAKEKKKENLVDERQLDF